MANRSSRVRRVRQPPTPQVKQCPKCNSRNSDHAPHKWSQMVRIDPRDGSVLAQWEMELLADHFWCPGVYVWRPVAELEEFLNTPPEEGPSEVVVDGP